METIEKSIAIIGIGNCGSQVAALAEKKYPELFDTVYINSSDADLAMCPSENSLKFKIGEKSEVEGSGKNRMKMKEYLMADINKITGSEEFQDIIIEKKYCFVVTSAAGGTGSGAAPVMLELLRQVFPDTNFILVAVLPQIGASLMEQGNTLEFLNELYGILGEQTTYMIYDNETVSELPPTIALESVNSSIVEDIRVLSGVDNLPTPYESIDAADMESIISTPGRLMVVRLRKGLTEKFMEDNKLDDMIIKAIKQSHHAETDRNKRVVRWGIITYFTKAVNSLYTGTLDGLLGFIGTPYERFNHNAINNGREDMNYMHIIASGMSPVNDRTQKVVDRIDELKAALASDDTSKFILSGDGASYNELLSRRKEGKRAASGKEVDPSAIFKKFMSKDQ